MLRKKFPTGGKIKDDVSKRIKTKTPRRRYVWRQPDDFLLNGDLAAKKSRRERTAAGIGKNNIEFIMDWRGVKCFGKAYL